MPEWPSLLVFVAAGLLLNLTPGPDVLYIVGRSLAQGRLAGIVSSLGIATGCLVHIAAGALGFSALLLAIPAAYDAMRIGGALYLAWLGFKALGSRHGGLEVAALRPVPLARIYRQGIVTNVLNPKVAIFFLAFLPQFTDAARGPLALQFVLLGVIFVVNGTIVCLGYAWAASSIGVWLKGRYHAARWMNRAMGALFIALGVRLAFDARR